MTIKICRMLAPAGVQESFDYGIVFPYHIGDFVIFCGALEEMMRRVPNARIAILGGPFLEELVLTLPGAPRFIVFDRQRFLKQPQHTLETLRRVRTMHFQRLIFPCYSRCVEADELIAAANADEKIGFAGNLSNYPSAAWRLTGERAYTMLLRDESDGQRAETDNYRRFLSQLFELPFPPIRQKMWINDSDRAESASLIQRIFAGKTVRRFVLVHAGSGSSIRDWPEEFFRTVLHSLRHSGFAVLLVGSVADRERSLRLARSCGEGVYDLTGSTTLRTLAALCESAEFFVGIESGPLHIAVAMNKPTIGILGGGHGDRFYPGDSDERKLTAQHVLPCYWCNWSCRFPEPYCMTRITPESVIEKISQLVGALPKTNHAP